MPSSTDALGEVLDGAADAIVAAARELPGSAPVVLIDGRSGSGKTTLAGLLAERWSSSLTVLALDSVYPGWDGLRAGADAVCEDVLEPFARGSSGSWRRWDWATDTPAETHTVDPGTALVVEGSGILTPRSAPLADITVWLESPLASRKQRALDRDGDGYRPHWERWAAQEDVHVAADAPRTLATLVFDIP